MDFYQHQDAARGRTTQLIVLYALAVLALGALAAGAMHGVLITSASEEKLTAKHWSLVATAAIVTWGLVLLGSTYKLMSLRKGGRRVAEMLGGSPVATSSANDVEKRCLNIVEEMAIASGLPVPPVYVLQSESGINAFAAGWSHDDAVIGVTRGALERLDREQLQGVIAHEFSHILNRDCSLNMRLLGVLHGIVVVSILGRILLRGGFSNRRGGALVLTGLSLWVMGSIGALMARLIQAAVSRQREYLADASAVQFTRNPSGLAGALAAIGTSSAALHSARGQEASHLLFEEPSASRWSRLASSHPALNDRIHRIVPDWDGDYSALVAASAVPPLAAGAEPRISEVRSRSESDLLMGFEGTRVSSAPPPPPESFESGRPLASAPEPPVASTALESAGELLSAIPPSLREAAQEPFSARALILAWLIDADPEHMTAQLSLLTDDEPLARETERLTGVLNELEGRLRLPLFDIAMGTLENLSPPQAHVFLARLSAMEKQLSPHAYRSYCLAALASRRLDPRARKKTRRLLVKNAIETVLSVLAHQGHPNQQLASAAYSKGVQRLGPRGRSLRLRSRSKLDVTRLDAAFATLLRLPVTTRASILSAAELIAAHDEVVEPAEAELLRTMATCLGVGHSPY